MNTNRPLLLLTRYALCVMLICYLPHWVSAPLWLSISILIAVGYKLLADYFGYPKFPFIIKMIVVVVALFALKVHYQSIMTGGFFIGFLLLFVGLKSIEVSSVRDIKVIIICNFYLIFTALILNQDLWIIAYLLMAILANLVLMFRLHASKITFKQLSRQSIKQLLFVIPLGLLLFYIFPRFAEPLWRVPSQATSQLGFPDTMRPGSIAELVQDERIAFRVTFTDKPLLNAYWRGLVLNYYNGFSWVPRPGKLPFYNLKELEASEKGDYEIIMEPHQQAWLFYTKLPVEARPPLQFSQDAGLKRSNNRPIERRFAYALKVQEMPFYQPLSQRALIQNLQQPINLNPLLAAWSKEQFNKNNRDPQAFISFLKRYIKQQPFWYTLSPPKLAVPNQMDYFWFTTQKGFCEHYASAVTFILRAAGIPARIVIGYQGGHWNPVAQYLTVYQNNAHAWVEYWQENRGWQAFDPTSFIAPNRIDESVQNWSSADSTHDSFAYSSQLSWLENSRLMLDSLRFYADRWLLFYNQEAQRDLLKKVGLQQLTMTQLLQVAIACFILFIVLIGLFYKYLQTRKLDRLTIEYELLQKQFRRLQVVTPSSATLHQQCRALIKKIPRLATTMATFLSHYEKLRLNKTSSETKKTKQELIALMKKLRKQLSNIK